MTTFAATVDQLYESLLPWVAWIGPDGEVHRLNGRQHDEWMMDRYPELWDQDETRNNPYAWAFKRGWIRAIGSAFELGPWNDKARRYIQFYLDERPSEFEYRGMLFIDSWDSNGSRSVTVDWDEYKDNDFKLPHNLRWRRSTDPSNIRGEDFRDTADRLTEGVAARSWIDPDGEIHDLKGYAHGHFIMNRFPDVWLQDKAPGVGDLYLWAYERGWIRTVGGSFELGKWTDQKRRYIQFFLDAYPEDFKLRGDLVIDSWDSTGQRSVTIDWDEFEDNNFMIPRELRWRRTIDNNYRQEEDSAVAVDRLWERDDYADNPPRYNFYDEVEWVDPKVIQPYMEYPDRVPPDDLIDSIKRHGMREPLILFYAQTNRKVLLVEGNHRLLVALQPGLDRVPARVVRVQTLSQSQDRKAGRVSGYEADQFGYVPGDLSPSQVGIPTLGRAEVPA